MKHTKLLLLGIIAIGICACSPQKRIIYMQDAVNNSEIKLPNESQIRIKPLDRLTGVVSSKDNELAYPFNTATSYNALTNNPYG